MGGDDTEAARGGRSPRAEPGQQGFGVAAVDALEDRVPIAQGGVEFPVEGGAPLLGREREIAAVQDVPRREERRNRRSAVEVADSAVST